MFDCVIKCPKMVNFNIAGKNPFYSVCSTLDIVIFLLSWVVIYILCSKVCNCILTKVTVLMSLRCVDIIDTYKCTFYNCEVNRYIIP